MQFVDQLYFTCSYPLLRQRRHQLYFIYVIGIKYLLQTTIRNIEFLGMIFFKYVENYELEYVGTCPKFQ